MGVSGTNVVWTNNKIKQKPNHTRLAMTSLYTYKKTIENVKQYSFHQTQKLLALSSIEAIKVSTPQI